MVDRARGGGAVSLAGLAGLLRDATMTMPLVWLKWLVGLLLVHDFMVAPLVNLTGRRLRERATAAWRWPLQLGLVTSGVLVLASVPVLVGVGRRSQPGNASVLQATTRSPSPAFSPWYGWASSPSGSGARPAGADGAHRPAFARWSGRSDQTPTRRGHHLGAPDPPPRGLARWVGPEATAEPAPGCCAGPTRRPVGGVTRSRVRSGGGRVLAAALQLVLWTSRMTRAASTSWWASRNRRTASGSQTTSLWSAHDRALTTMSSPSAAIRRQMSRVRPASPVPPWTGG
jgi:hypothetical protein